MVVFSVINLVNFRTPLNFFKKQKWASRRCDTLPVRMNDLPLEKRLKDDEDGSSGFSAVPLVDAIRTATSVDEWSNFGGLVLVCIDSYDSESRRSFQH